MLIQLLAALLVLAALQGELVCDLLQPAGWRLRPPCFGPVGCARWPAWQLVRTGRSTPAAPLAPLVPWRSTALTPHRLVPMPRCLLLASTSSGERSISCAEGHVVWRHQRG